MKRIFSLLFSLVMCFGMLVSCNDETPSESSTSEEPLEAMFLSYSLDSYKCELSEDEAKIVKEIANASDFHVEDLCDCYVYYEFSFGEKRVRYHENVLEDLATWKVKKLSEEEQTLLDGIVYSHFSRMDEEENRFSWQHDD